MLGVIWNGEPGTVWTNDTKELWFQWLCSLINTCPVCLPYHLAIFYEPVGQPVHRCCRCRWEVIEPQGKAKPSADFREILKDMPASERFHAVGRSNYTLLQRHLVEWADLVEPNRIRKFSDVVRVKGFTLDQLVKAGIKLTIAERGVREAMTPGDAALTAYRAELLGGLNQDGHSGSNDEETEASAPRNATKRAERPEETLRRIHAGLDHFVEHNRPRMVPDFKGSVPDAANWLRKHIPEFGKVLTETAESESAWLLVAELVDAQTKLRRLFSAIGVDPEVGMRAVLQ